MRRIRHARFLQGEGGQTSLEFVLFFPLIILVFSMLFEAAVLSLRQAMLNVAAQDVTRELRIASAFAPSQAELIALACEKAVVFPGCESALTIEIAPVDTETWAIDRGTMDCIDRDSGFVPVQDYQAGGGNDLMMVRICAVFEPIFPTIGLGAQMRRVNESDYAIVAVAAYTNEPI